MKKLLAAVLALTMILSFTACVNNTTPDDTANGDAPAYFAELQTPGKILVGTSPDYPPYESYDGDKIVGFDIDALEEIAAILSEDAKVTLEWVPMDFDPIISALQVGQIDIGVSCFTYSPDRDVLFSTPYLKSAQVVAVQAGSNIKTLADLEGKKIGAGAGTTGEAAAKEIKDTTVSSLGDYLVMFETLRNGGLDAVVCDEAVGANYATQADFELLSEKLIDEEVSVIIKKGNDEMLAAFNAAIEKFMTSPKYAELKAKWGLN